MQPERMTGIGNRGYQGVGENAKVVKRNLENEGCVTAIFFSQ
jgi:hypothetical protein